MGIAIVFFFQLLQPILRLVILIWLIHKISLLNLYSDGTTAPQRQYKKCRLKIKLNLSHVMSFASLKSTYETRDYYRKPQQ